MPDRPTGVTDNAPAAGVTDVDVVERPSSDLTTVTTADPGTGGTTLAVTANARMTGYKIRVIGTSGVAEVMYVTAGAGTASLTVTRGQEGTTGVAHSVGATVQQMVGVQRVENIEASKIVTYRGRTATFKTPGRAAVSQKIAAIHNATASTVLVSVNRIKVDVLITAVKAVTIAVPLIRIVRFTAVPTNGTALAKTPLDSALASNSAVTVWGDASADGTGSTTTLTITIPANTILSQTYGPRVFTAVGYELIDTETFFEGEPDITLRALEGIAVFLDAAVVTTGNPATDFWTATIDWAEHRTV